VHLHQKIRNDIEGRIMSGEWAPGHRLPYEHELMAEYGCSRMTVSKVLSALAAQGLITRRRRAGSVVAAPSADQAVLEIRDFARDAKLSNRIYRHETVHRSVEPVDAATASRTGLAVGAKVLSIDTLHLLDGRPEAYEERIISLASVPDVRKETFEDVPPGTWLLNRVPWTDAEHVIRAVNADAKLHKRLQVATGEACLVLERRTWQAGAFITEARIVYPGERHRLVGRFSPTGNGQGRRLPSQGSGSSPMFYEEDVSPTAKAKARGGE
jgi:GntR family histidine utilization transcriptional repressor